MPTGRRRTLQDRARQATARHRTNGTRVLLASVAACAAGLVIAAPAGALPVITGSDADVWNAASPGGRYVLTTDERNRRIAWALEETAPGEDGPMPGRVRTGTGRSPLTVAPTDIGDGTFRLTASDRDGDPVRRTFLVDRTPPVIVLTQPAVGWTVLQGVAAVAAYTCTGATSCAGTVPAAAPLDTSRAGDAAFRVDASDAAGNSAVVQAAYRILPPDAPLPSPPTTGPPTPPAPAAPGTALIPPAPTTPGVVVARAGTGPRPLNAARMRPRLNGAVASRRPVLRWPAIRGARLFNVQVFRIRAGAAPAKVASIFPSANRVRLPPGRLRDGARYAWRVWPFMRGGYPAAPFGVSLFKVRIRTR